MESRIFVALKSVSSLMTILVINLRVNYQLTAVFLKWRGENGSKHFFMRHLRVAFSYAFVKQGASQKHSILEV